MSLERKPIPWKALENFDLKSYPVCIEAYAEIDLLFKEPNMKFNYNDDLVRKHKKLYEFLVSF